MKVEDVVEVSAGVAAGVAIPVAIFTTVAAGAPVAGGAAIMYALKKLGFGIAKRGVVTLAAAGAVSGAAAGKSARTITEIVHAKLDESSQQVVYAE